MSFQPSEPILACNTTAIPNEVWPLHQTNTTPTLLNRHRRFEHCPALSFENSREGLRTLIDRIKTSAPLIQVQIVLEVMGHYHQALLHYLQEQDIAKSVPPNPRPCSYLALHVVDMLTKNTVVVSSRWPLSHTLFPFGNTLMGTFSQKSDGYFRCLFPIQMSLHPIYPCFQPLLKRKSLDSPFDENIVIAIHAKNGMV